MKPVSRSSRTIVRKTPAAIKTARKTSALKKTAAINITADRTNITRITEKERFLK